MTVGNLIALRQQHIIRLLAYSGIAQSGYVLVAFALIDPGDAGHERAGASNRPSSIWRSTRIMDLGAFAAAVAFARRGGSYFIDDYTGLWQRSPVLATLLAGFLISLAGVPPMAGFWAKLFVFLATIDAEVYWLAVVMGVNAVIAAWYYLAVVKRMFFDARRGRGAGRGASPAARGDGRGRAVPPRDVRLSADSHGARRTLVPLTFL